MMLSSQYDEMTGEVAANLTYNMAQRENLKRLTNEIFFGHSTRGRIMRRDIPIKFFALDLNLITQSLQFTTVPYV